MPPQTQLKIFSFFPKKGPDQEDLPKGGADNPNYPGKRGGIFLGFFARAGAISSKVLKGILSPRAPSRGFLRDITDQGGYRIPPGPLRGNPKKLILSITQWSGDKNSCLPNLPGLD